MEKVGGSRLLQMQARFQQRQLQEREHKIASLYEAQQARALDRVRHSPAASVGSPPLAAPVIAPPAPLQPAPPAAHQPGKVRQMFEERRTKAGIDKSYPLQPIQNTERAPHRRTVNGYNKISTAASTVERKLHKTTVSKTSINSNTFKKHTVTKIAKLDNMVNGSRDVNHNHETDLNTAFTHSNGISIHYKDRELEVDETDNAANNYLIENETFPEALAPAATPRSAESVEKKQQKTLPPRKSKSPLKVKPQATAPPSRTVERKTVHGRPSIVAQRSSNPIKSSLSKLQTSSLKSLSKLGGSEGEACVVCGRRFAPDRIAKHQEICQKASTKKRKPYDVIKHRLAGTEAEPFLNKIRRGTAASASTRAPQPQPSNWRKKHEEFIQAIRAAKKVQAHLEAGGKLADLPPPPPSENPDYVQCPHCSRRFNQTAAERHIPQCANFQFNKPKRHSPKKR